MKDLKNLTGAKILSKNQQKDVLGGGDISDDFKPFENPYICQSSPGDPSDLTELGCKHWGMETVWLNGVCYICR